MVWDKRPGKATRVSFSRDLDYPLDKIVPIDIVVEDVSPLDTAADYVVQGTRHVESCLTWHFLTAVELESYNVMGVPLVLLNISDFHLANTPVNGGAVLLISSSYKLSSARGVRFYRPSLARVFLDYLGFIQPMVTLLSAYQALTLSHVLPSA